MSHSFQVGDIQNLKLSGWTYRSLLCPFTQVKYTESSFYFQYVFTNLEFTCFYYSAMLILNSPSQQ